MSFTPVATSARDPESPLDTTLINAVYENPLGIAAGDSGAPKIQAAALEQTGGSEAVITAAMRDLNVTTAKLADLNVTTGKIADRNVTGIKIALAGVQNENLADYAIDNDKIDFLGLYASKMNKSPVMFNKWTVAAGATVTPSGLFNVVTTSASLEYELDVLGSPRTWPLSSGMYAFDGTNMRIRNSSGSTTYDAYYQQWR